VGFAHTVLGPDHYVPFVMMSWARKWSVAKTMLVTVICGIGHLAGSVLLGLTGIGLGLAVRGLEIAESFRGSIAAWLLIAFGLVYLVWGLRRAYRSRPHSHSHSHGIDDRHSHTHTHHREHTHIHDETAKANITPWMLFVVFVFGPCEVLIPLLMYPAAEKSFSVLVAVTCVFGVATIGTMSAAVLLLHAGVRFIQFPRLERFAHVITGGTILLCGLAIEFLGF
jgi:ABC-type nickel/cobalt efflux system permease component RcnA